ncbi:MAG TPA: hypothetical protein VFU07_09180 [Candidatus Lumbricidophila sp.]|nr:hypothetical protein [Candidatus Lumbricidophila sp.]
MTSRRLRRSDLHAPFRGIRTLELPESLAARCRALAPVMSASQHFSHVTAARLWGIPLPADFEAAADLHVSTHQRPPERRGVIGHRTAARRDVYLLEGLPVVAPADAWCDLASVRLPGGRLLTLNELIVAGDRLLGWPTPLALNGEIDEALHRHRGSRGSRMLRLAHAEMRAGSGSPRETLLRLLIARSGAGYPTPELNGPIRLSRGGTIYGDLVFRRQKVLAEYDGGQHRTETRQFLRDVDRHNDLANDGWQVIRVHSRTPDRRILSLLDAALRARGWQP